MTNLLNPTEDEDMSMRKLGGTLSREIARTGIAVLAVAAVVLIYQGCSQPIEPIAQAPAAQGVVSAQEEAAPEAAPEQPVADEAMPAPEQPIVDDPHAGHAMSDMQMPKKAVAVITPTVGNSAAGTVTLTQQEDGVLIEADITGLEPGKHGFHIHEFGDISAPDGTSAGGHYAPATEPHGAPDAAQRHMGDLGNIEAGEDGNATYSRVDTVVKLHYVVGRAVVVHAGEDDLQTQPTGDAGGRIGIGVIGIAKSE